MNNDKTVTMSRELAERLIKGDASRGASALQLADAWKAMGELRALLAAPVVERQEPFAWVVVSPDGKEFSELQSSEDYAKDLAHDMDGDLPPNHSGGKHEIKGVFTSPPAPVAVIDPVLGSTPEDHMRWLLDKVVSPGDYPQSVLHDQIRDTLARLDKVKELNQ